MATIAVIALLPRASAAQATSPSVGAATIVAQGNGRGAPACISCHGPQMLGNAVGGIPRLAGLNAEYLETQLDALASGARKNATMLPVASSLSAAERHAVAQYLGALPAPVSPPVASDTAAPASPAILKRGERLAVRGDWPRELPGCDQCHGPAGVGVGTAFPALAGQSPLYATNQLNAWKLGTRPSGPLGLMAAIARRMTADDIAAVAAYYAAQPSTRGASPERRP
ncbi:MAG: c-type cytochrome [Gemmatimonadaceae bacterium]